MPRKKRSQSPGPGRRSPRNNAGTAANGAATSRPVTPRPGTPVDGDAKDTKAAATRKPKEAHVVPKQADLLAEAIETEAINRRWLDVKKREALAREGADEYKLDRNTNKQPRRISTRATTVVNFPQVESMPDMLRFVPPPPVVPDKTCCITGKSGRYKCPRTGLLYHDLAAFKELRRRHNLPSLLRTNTLVDYALVEDQRTELELPVKPPVLEPPRPPSPADPGDGDAMDTT